MRVYLSKSGGRLTLSARTAAVTVSPARRTCKSSGLAVATSGAPTKNGLLSPQACTTCPTTSIPTTITRRQEWANPREDPMLEEHEEPDGLLTPEQDAILDGIHAKLAARRAALPADVREEMRRVLHRRCAAATRYRLRQERAGDGQGELPAGNHDRASPPVD